MGIDKSTSLQEKTDEISRSNAIMMKLAVTQNVIRKKFEKACMNRLEQENDVKQAMKPHMESLNDATSLSIAKQSQPITNYKKLQEIRSVQYIKNTNNPNELCNRLRMIAGDVKHVEERNAIIMKLRELEILL